MWSSSNNKKQRKIVRKFSAIHVSWPRILLPASISTAKAKFLIIASLSTIVVGLPTVHFMRKGNIPFFVHWRVNSLILSLDQKLPALKFCFPCFRFQHLDWNLRRFIFFAISVKQASSASSFVTRHLYFPFIGLFVFPDNDNVTLN